MKVNPGGRLAVADIVGRDKEIARYWSILRRQGLILSAERRIGKTHIAFKMWQCGEPGFAVIYQDLEGVHSRLELVRSVYRAVEADLSTGVRLVGKFAAAWSTLMPGRIADINLPSAADNWKALLSTAIDDVVAQLEPEQKLLLIWDELPLMLHNIRHREGPDQACEFLDHLRHLRQTHGERLRFFFTGSIGLHLVLDSLRAAGYANDATNDMYADTVPPMERSATISLATLLLQGIEHPPGNSKLVATEIADCVGGFPYYIHHVVDQMCLLDRAPEPKDVALAVHRLVQSDQDPANFGYYVDRIKTHYVGTLGADSLHLLDTIALEEEPMSMGQLANLVRTRSAEMSDERVKELVRLLRRDHYLHIVDQAIGENQCYGFRWDLVKRWWRENRL